MFGSHLPPHPSTPHTPRNQNLWSGRFLYTVSRKLHRTSYLGGLSWARGSGLNPPTAPSSSHLALGSPPHSPHTALACSHEPNLPCHEHSHPHPRLAAHSAFSTPPSSSITLLFSQSTRFPLRSVHHCALFSYTQPSHTHISLMYHVVCTLLPAPSRSRSRLDTASLLKLSCCSLERTCEGKRGGAGSRVRVRIGVRVKVIREKLGVKLGANARWQGRGAGSRGRVKLGADVRGRGEGQGAGGGLGLG